MKPLALLPLLALSYLSHAQAPQPLFAQPTPAQAKADEKLFNSKAWNTPYKTNLSEDEKVAGLSKFWAEAKYNFAFFDKVPTLSWDSLYLAYLPKVRATTSMLRYYEVLQEMCAQLHDGHSNVYPPEELFAEAFEAPPVRTALIEGKVVLTEVRSPSLRQQGVVPGVEVLAIDGVPVRTYAQQRIAPYQSASTSQDREMRTYSARLLAGAANQPVTLSLQDAKGRQFTRTLARSGYSDAQSNQPPLLEVKVLKGNIGYVALNSFADKALLTQFADAYPQLKQTKALILDVRRNGGGNSDIGFSILKYLLDKPFQTTVWHTRDYRPSYRPWELPELWYGEAEAPVSPQGATPYAGKVVVLTSARTFSAAEDFAVAFDYAKRGLIIGEPTGGSTGQPLSFSLPGGGSARVCTKRDTYPDGKEFVGVGVQPQRVVHPTISDVRAGRDTVLESALHEIH
ncbi:S41 family peptidase [Hymenobacter sp. GOD-10R]|uniref:S41 family peptidase n=1 Tax=Hymenobacter sp. GOD-10R TaxID=3093922 RepID=UPI002D76C34F|nr:S41 family peptidase [Hymenobacter sp. GOD-10R]WRQ26596.1 S41 family peptidase [Hymenobacter sp. GOD-10R]